MTERVRVSPSACSSFEFCGVAMRVSMLSLSTMLIATVGGFAYLRQDAGSSHPTNPTVSIEKTVRLPGAVTTPGDWLDGAPENTKPDFITTGSVIAPFDASTAATTSPPAAAAQKTTRHVDESALRYFAAKGDQARLQAEIARLRALYPEWTPPADPLAAPSIVDHELDAMWKLYADGKLDALERAVAERQSREPGWQVPPDLLDRMQLAKVRSQLMASAEQGHYEDVVKLAAANASLLTCGDAEVLWRLADAFVRTDRLTRARDAYAYMLDHCDNAQERLATAQKASELLPVAMLEELLEKEKRASTGVGEFESVRNDLARKLLGDADADPKLIVKPEHIARVERLATVEEKASDALLLGWYHYRRDEPEKAEKWFRQAYQREETASAAEGLALTLIARKSPLEAEQVLYPWRDATPEIKQSYLAAVANLLALDPLPIVAENVLMRMASVVLAERDAKAAEQFGWYARTLKQSRTASEWFHAALSWKADNEPAAYGLVLTLADLGDKQGVKTLQNQWASQSMRIATLGRSEAEQPDRNRVTLPTGPALAEDHVLETSADPGVERFATAAFSPSRRPASGSAVVDTAPLAPSQATVAPANTGRARKVSRAKSCALVSHREQLSPQQALDRGWCLMDLNRPMEAALAFEDTITSGNGSLRQDGGYGQALAYLRAGLPDKAAATVARVPQRPERAAELQISILGDKAVKTFKVGQYRQVLALLDQRARLAPEQSDLLLLRAYAYQKLGYWTEARQVFQALADTGNRAGLRGLADINAAQYGP